MAEDNFLSKISIATDAVKMAIELAKKSNDVPFLEKLYEARETLLELQEENFELKKKLKESEEKQSINLQLRVEGNAYWSVSENGKKDGPYCTTCWDANRKLIRFALVTDNYVKCNNCKFEGALQHDRFGTADNIEHEYDPFDRQV